MDCRSACVVCTNMFCATGNQYGSDADFCLRYQNLRGGTTAGQLMPGMKSTMTILAYSTCWPSRTLSQKIALSTGFLGRGCNPPGSLLGSALVGSGGLRRPPA